MAVEDYLGALEQGVTKGFKKIQARKDRVANQERLKRKEELTLAKAGYSRGEDGKLTPSDNSDAQVAVEQNKILLGQMQTMRRGLTFSKTKQATADVMRTGKASYLQNLLADPEIADTFKKRNIHQFASIDFDNDQDLLKVYGIANSEQLDAQARKDLSRKFFKAYNGKEWVAFPIDTFAAHTGYLKEANAEQMSIYADYSSIGKSKEDPAITEARVGKLNAQTEVQVAKVDTEKSTQNKNNAMAGKANEAGKAQTVKAESDKTFKEGSLSVKESEHERKLAKDAVDAKDKEAKFKYKQELDAEGRTGKERGKIKAKGIQQNFQTAHGLSDISVNTYVPRTPKARAELANAARAIMTARDYEPNSAVLKEASKTAELVALGAKATAITYKDVGFIDDFTHSVAGKVTENPDYYKNIGAKSAYEAYKGLFRVSLIGSAQTESELRYFRKFLGDQTEQAIKLREQLKISLQGLKSRLQPVMDAVPNVLVAKHLFGTTLEELDWSIKELSKARKSKKEVSKDIIESALKGVPSRSKQFQPPQPNAGESKEDYIKRAKNAQKEFNK